MYVRIWISVFLQLRKIPTALFTEFVRVAWCCRFLGGQLESCLEVSLFTAVLHSLSFQRWDTIKLQRNMKRQEDDIGSPLGKPRGGVSLCCHLTSWEWGEGEVINFLQFQDLKYCFKKYRDNHSPFFFSPYLFILSIFPEKLRVTFVKVGAGGRSENSSRFKQKCQQQFPAH